MYGPNVMQGYHNRPEENDEVFTPDGGFRTGDMGYIDDDGFLFITGRIKEQYKLENGKYVVPAPLEEQLKLSPYIVNVMVHGANGRTTSRSSCTTRRLCANGRARKGSISWTLHAIPA